MAPCRIDELTSDEEQLLASQGCRGVASTFPPRAFGLRALATAALAAALLCVASIAPRATVRGAADVAAVEQKATVEVLPVGTGVADEASSGGQPTRAAFSTGPSPEFRTFLWTAPLRTASIAFDVAFAAAVPWKDVDFTEGGAVTRGSVLKWVQQDLLGGPDPFAGFGGVPVPFPPQDPEPPDQLPPGQWVTYSRRQLCYIAAKSLLGANTLGYANGLLRYLDTPAGACTPASGDFGRALWYLLAACSVDPGLAGGAQGPSLLAAKAMWQPSVAEVRAAAEGKPLSGAGLRTCQYNDGAPPLKDIEKVPEAACKQPTKDLPGQDYMTGGLPGQGLVDISAAWLGGYIWGNNCGIGGGQDERLMVSMPEVFVLAFFLSEHPGSSPYSGGTPQLRQPAWILGARQVLAGLDGTAASFDPRTLHAKASTPMTSDLVKVEVHDMTMDVSSSSPFLAFMSENQDFEIGYGCRGLTPKNYDRGAATRQARENRNPWQRAVDSSCPFAFEKQVRAWYGATALVSYDEKVRSALRKVVKSLGTGPWGAGLWWGDSQLMTLAVWLAHAVAAPTWGDGGLSLDYYLYSAFTENPGNQCFVHREGHCVACLQQCGTPPPFSYWIPGFAYSGVDPRYEGWEPPPPPAKACVVAKSSCGREGLAEVVAAYKGKTAADLWKDVEAALRGAAGARNVGSNPFDVLLASHGTAQ